jgi:hypothetical protein
MESIDTRIKRLELITDNHDERIMDHDKRLRQSVPVLLMNAKRNLLTIVSLGLALVSILMQLLNNK